MSPDCGPVDSPDDLLIYTINEVERGKGVRIFVTSVHFLQIKYVHHMLV